METWQTGIPVRQMMCRQLAVLWIWQSVQKRFMSIWSMSLKGEPKIVKELRYPITGEQCVNRIYTDLCIIELKDQKAYVKGNGRRLNF